MRARERQREKGMQGSTAYNAGACKRGENSACSKQEEGTRLLPVLICVVAGGLQVRDCMRYIARMRHRPFQLPSLLVGSQQIPNRRHCCNQSFQEGRAGTHRSYSCKYSCMGNVNTCWVLTWPKWCAKTISTMLVVQPEN